MKEDFTEVFVEEGTRRRLRGFHDILKILDLEEPKKT